MQFHQRVVWATALLCALLMGMASGMPPDKWATEKRKVAVVFSDVKFDDKAAIWTLMLDPQYYRVLVITSGIDAHHTAATSLLEFFHAQGRSPTISLRVDKTKLLILHGNNPLSDPAPHEVWYHGLQPTQFNDVSDLTLQAALHGKSVAVFQIAPTPLADVEAVLRNADPGSVKSVMLLHGYNSRQVTMAEQERFITSLRPLLKASNPRAEVYFTSTFASYPNKDGGKQPLQWVRSFFPRQEVEQALKDPFWSGQLIRGRRYISDPAVLSLLPLDNPAELDRLVFLARSDPSRHTAERQHIVTYVNAVLEKIQPGHLDERLEGRYKHTFLPEFTGQTTVELADAAHIAMFHRFMADKQPSTIASLDVRYPHGVTDERANPAFETDFGFALIPHGKLIIGGRADLDRAWIEDLAHFRVVLPH